MLSHTVMRAALLGFVGLFAISAGAGCGPGLTRHSQQAKAPAQPDVFTTMDAELKNALVGTTTVTSGEQMPLPESRLPLAQWDGDATPAPPPAQPWGAPEEPQAGQPSPAEAAAPSPASKIPPEIPAKRDPLSYP